MDEASLPLENRVTDSLARLGFAAVEVTNLGDGKIRLAGQVRDSNAMAMVVAAVGTVAGVTEIDNQLQIPVED